MTLFQRTSRVVTSLDKRTQTSSRVWRLGIGAVLAAVLATSVIAKGQAPVANPYAPYAFLIGEWNVAPDGGGSAVGAAQFRWGPNNSYIWYAGSLVVNGVLTPHFEGILMWNGVRKNLDMLLAVDLQHGLAQEQGVVSVAPDGTVVRETTAIYSEGIRPLGLPVAGPEGAIGHFRQTFTATTPDRILTKVMRQSGQDWVATFPGSDHLVMTRR
jgi:hypothetical protein